MRRIDHLRGTAGAASLGVIRRALAFAALGLVSACTEPPAADVDNPNAGLLRDFLDGKFDGAGHPVNAKVVEAETLCAGSGVVHDGAIELTTTCDQELPVGATAGQLTVNVRMRVQAHAASGAIATVNLADAAGTSVGTQALTVSRLRGRSSWIDLPVTVERGAARIQISPAPGAVIEVDYVEVFPTRFGLVLSPGSGVVADGDKLTFELPKARKLEKLEADGVELTARLDQLILDHEATRTSTAFRTLIEVRVADLLPERTEITELRVHAGSDAARLQLRRTAAPCGFEGDAAAATKVLVTGFQPFPADGWHDNVSGVAVTAMNPAAIHGARVMRLVLPVEYDRAAAAIAETITRCQPDVVISFGQGGDAIALEEVAYNLQDTGEISGGVPDNRGIIRAAQPIDEAAPATRDTLLPLPAIEAALEAIGEAPRHSRDPGRYICNNVMFIDIATMLGAGHGRAGFIHLPYTTSFDDTVRARFGKVVEAAIQATVDAP